MRAARSPYVVVLLAAALAGCSTPASGAGTTAVPTAAPTSSPVSPSAAPSRTGTAAEPLSTALRRRRGTRAWCGSGANELALQFEFVNKADRPITPDTLGIDQYERVLMLVDLPRSTAYETLTAQGNDGRISESATASRCPREERSR